MRVGYLGPAGTFTHEALLVSTGADTIEAMPLATARADRIEAVPLPTVFDTIMAVEEGRVDRGLVPIENSLEGGVGATLDTLATGTERTSIVGEVLHGVRHCLVGREPVEPAALRTVVSHPQALAQCARFLRTQAPRAAILPASSTAEAVRQVAAGAPAEQPAAALGTRLAAELYGAVVLREGVEDGAGNVTRFVWLAREAAISPDQPPHWKTTLVWWGADDEAPGWLVRCLSEFAFRGVNLTRIESRPRRIGLGHYMFFADLDGRDREPPLAEAITALRAQAETVRVLGSYPAAA